MARTYNSAGRHEFTTPAGLSLPFSIACWFNPANVTGSYNAITLGVAGATDQGRLQLNLMGGVAGDYVRASSRNSSGTEAAANSTAGYSASTWQHACAVFTSTTSRAAYFNGTNKGTNTTSNTVNSLTLGIFGGAVTTTGVRSNNYAGSLAEVGIWNVALTDDEVATLAAGISTSRVCPESLLAWWPLFDSDGDVDYWGQHNASVVSSVSYSQHPTTVCYPNSIYTYAPKVIIPEYRKFFNPFKSFIKGY
jgi:hypothetical protein